MILVITVVIDWKVWNAFICLSHCM